MPEDMTEVGQVCCDLWWTTIIEKEQLVKILEEALLEKGEENPEERAKVLLDDYIKQEANGYLNEIKVEHGQYWLYHYEGSEGFNDKFASPDLLLHPSIEAKFVLSPRKLELVDKIDLEQNQSPKM